MSIVVLALITFAVIRQVVAEVEVASDASTLSPKSAPAIVIEVVAISTVEDPIDTGFQVDVAHFRDVIAEPPVPIVKVLDPNEIGPIMTPLEIILIPFWKRSPFT